ncbi:MAG TPA: hypothetical protein VGX25_04190 [Actinophytocola sp.]|uniref:hypothetical protein n=1 Tax=Actinophytocola sp. TaxID=1872138 RepID=UPI002DDCD290|nr:hypothetical protein [Actinophytocola sp.]HEV2778579.1 hypothetical protein [Actinophytocola sp.]
MGSADVDDVPHQPIAFRGFRYVFPDTPVATASVDIGHVGVGFELFLRGELTVSARVRRSPVDQRAIRACALKALRAMAKGVMVGGIGSYAPTVTAPGLEFVQSGYRFRAPGTMAFTGTCTIDVARRCDCGTVGVVGAVEYALELTATPARMIDAEPAKERAWFLRHEEELASIGVVVLVAVPIAPGQLVSR